MTLTLDRQIFWLVEGVVAVLVAASLVGFFLSRRVRSEGGKAIVENLNARIRSWWIMIGIFALAVLVGRAGCLLLFAFVSFLVLREYGSLIPTVPADHRTLIWSFFLFAPLHYWALYERWYLVAGIMIPVYGFLFIPLRVVLTGGAAGFLDRAARIQWGLMVSVYCLSYAAALLTLEIPGYQRQSAKLVLFLLILVQFSDIVEYMWDKLLGKKKIAPDISPDRTWEGLVGGVASTGLLGMGLWWATPFSPLMALSMALLAALLGFAGALVMSAIKCDRGPNDYSGSTPGPSGILDHVGSICFAAPVFFHLAQYIYLDHIVNGP